MLLTLSSSRHTLAQSFCASLATCAPYVIAQPAPFGAEGYRILGTAGEGCAVSYYAEDREGGVSLYRCYAARGAACDSDPWSELRVELLEAARACDSDDDCMWIASNVPPFDHCSCMAAVNRDIDVGLWRNLNLTYDCYEFSGCCEIVAPSVACIDGRCASSEGP